MYPFACSRLHILRVSKTISIPGGSTREIQENKEINPTLVFVFGDLVPTYLFIYNYFCSFTYLFVIYYVVELKVHCYVGTVKLNRRLIYS